MFKFFHSLAGVVPANASNAGNAKPITPTQSQTMTQTAGEVNNVARITIRLASGETRIISGDGVSSNELKAHAAESTRQPIPLGSVSSLADYNQLETVLASSSIQKPLVSDTGEQGRIERKHAGPPQSEGTLSASTETPRSTPADSASAPAAAFHSTAAASGAKTSPRHEAAAESVLGQASALQAGALTHAPKDNLEHLSSEERKERIARAAKASPSNESAAMAAAAAVSAAEAADFSKSDIEESLASFAKNIQEGLIPKETDRNQKELFENILITQLMSEISEGRFACFDKQGNKYTTPSNNTIESTNLDEHLELLLENCIHRVCNSVFGERNNIFNQYKLTLIKEFLITIRTYLPSRDQALRAQDVLANIGGLGTQSPGIVGDAIPRFEPHLQNLEEKLKVSFELRRVIIRSFLPFQKNLSRNEIIVIILSSVIRYFNDRQYPTPKDTSENDGEFFYTGASLNDSWIRKIQGFRKYLEAMFPADSDDSADSGDSIDITAAAADSQSELALERGAGSPTGVPSQQATGGRVGNEMQSPKKPTPRVGASAKSSEAFDPEALPPPGSPDPDSSPRAQTAERAAAASRGTPKLLDEKINNFLRYDCFHNVFPSAFGDVGYDHNKEIEELSQKIRDRLLETFTVESSLRDIRVVELIYQTTREHFEALDIYKKKDDTGAAFRKQIVHDLRFFDYCQDYLNTGKCLNEKEGKSLEEFLRDIQGLIRVKIENSNKKI